MQILTHTLNSFESILQHIFVSCCWHHVFRWVKNQTYQLKPSVWRITTRWDWVPVDADNVLSKEIDLLEKFKIKISPTLTKEPKDDRERLALAQHHWLPTRLLDWTESPLVALYFATEPQVSHNWSIKPCNPAWWALRKLHCCWPVDTSEINPFEIEQCELFYSPAVSNRINWQMWLFTIQTNPLTELQDCFVDWDTRTIEKIIFTQEVAQDIQKKLFSLWIRRWTLFPDLDWYAMDVKTKCLIWECHDHCHL